MCFKQISQQGKFKEENKMQTEIKLKQNKF